MESPCVWRRTWPDVAHDFTAERDGQPVGRIYRHTDGQRWQWFSWRGTCTTGIADTRAEAITCIETQARQTASQTARHLE
jgi:hypothetical protein